MAAAAAFVVAIALFVLNGPWKRMRKLVPD